ncbi:hypothetical protein KTI95_03320 [Acinetobacter baumannii]|nr:hypothetical protein [Acinetobacter baumannii]
MDNQELLKLFYEKLSSFTPDDLENRFRKAESELETLGFFEEFSDDIVEYYSSNNILHFIKMFDESKQEFESKHHILKNRILAFKDSILVEKIKPDFQTLINHYICDIDSTPIIVEWSFFDNLSREDHKKKLSKRRETPNFDSRYIDFFNLENKCGYEKVDLVVGV